MATIFRREEPATGPRHEDAGMALGMAVAMALVLFTGFSLNLALGRSSFAVPAIYHIHGITFFAWTVLFVMQVRLAATGAVAAHRRLGRLAALVLPLLVVLGTAMVVTSLQRTGGPFFFAQNEFLWGNTLGLLCFVGLAMAALAKRHQTDWHARLMLSGMALLTGPGFGRILPMPLFMPWAWWVGTGVSLVFPLAGMVIDWRRRGRIHPAWLWAVGVIVVVHLASMAVAASAPGLAFTRWVIEGTPGAARPMEAFLP